MWITAVDGFAYNLSVARCIMINIYNNIVAVYDADYEICLKQCTSYEEAIRQFNDLLQLLSQ